MQVNIATIPDAELFERRRDNEADIRFHQAELDCAAANIAAINAELARRAAGAAALALKGD